jgi:hypothetical protein
MLLLQTPRGGQLRCGNVDADEPRAAPASSARQPSTVSKSAPAMIKATYLTISGGGSIQVASFSPTAPPGLTARAYSRTACRLSGTNAVTDSSMTALMGK